ncbi:MAG: hypothetical protein ACYDCX_02455 [Acidithiobacillus sp.]
MEQENPVLKAEADHKTKSKGRVQTKELTIGKHSFVAFEQEDSFYRVYTVEEDSSMLEIGIIFPNSIGIKGSRFGCEITQGRGATLKSIGSRSAEKAMACLCRDWVKYLPKTRRSLRITTIFQSVLGLIEFLKKYTESLTGTTAAPREVNGEVQTFLFGQESGSVHHQAQCQGEPLPLDHPQASFGKLIQTPDSTPLPTCNSEESTSPPFARSGTTSVAGKG